MDELDWSALPFFLETGHPNTNPFKLNVLIQNISDI